MKINRNKKPLGLIFAIKSPKTNNEGEKISVIIAGKEHQFTGFAATSYNTATTGTPPFDGCISDKD